MSEEKETAEVVTDEITGQRVIKPKLVDTIDFVEETHKEMLANYSVTVGEDDKFTTARSVVALMYELAKKDQSALCQVVVHNYHRDSEGKEIMKSYEIASGQVSDVMDLLTQLVVPANDLLNQIMAVLMQSTEFTDAHAVMVTGVFDKQGVSAFTWANPDLELTEEVANRIYETAKSHAEYYKDKVAKDHGFVFADDKLIKGATMADLKKITKG